MASRYFATLRRMLKLVALAVLVVIAVPALAQNGDPVEVTANIEFVGVQSDIMIEDGDDFDSSGFGARGGLDVDFNLSPNTVARIEMDAGVFDYEGEGRETLTSYGAAVSIEHAVSDTLSVRLRARKVENIAVLEAFSADQTSVSARLQWEKGNDRIRVEADYRERDYDTTAAGHGEGWRLTAQYNRRFGPYHWLRLDARVEDMTSEDETRRSYDRRAVKLKYSHPVSKRLRIRPSIEYREWDYDARIARNDPEGDLRGDSYVAPGVDLSWGRSGRGPYARASAEYRIRESNDSRYGEDAARFGVVVGYRF